MLSKRWEHESQGRNPKPSDPFWGRVILKFVGMRKGLSLWVVSTSPEFGRVWVECEDMRTEQSQPLFTFSVWQSLPATLMLAWLNWERMDSGLSKLEREEGKNSKASIPVPSWFHLVQRVLCNCSFSLTQTSSRQHYQVVHTLLLVFLAPIFFFCFYNFSSVNFGRRREN